MPPVTNSATRETGKNWPAGYQLLPQWDFVNDESFLSGRNVPKEAVYRGDYRIEKVWNQTLLERAFDFWAGSRGQPNYAEAYTIIGSGHWTLVEMSAMSQLSQNCWALEVANGDGTVPLISAQASSWSPAENVHWVRETHAGLPGNQHVISAVEAILSGGKPSTLLNAPSRFSPLTQASLCTVSMVSPAKLSQAQAIESEPVATLTLRTSAGELALEPEPNEKTSSVPSLGGSMTLPRLRPTVRDHLKQVKREFDEALESCVSKSIAECKGPPPLSVENSEGVLVCKMLAGIHHECDRTFEPGDLAPISTEHYQRERWEIVGDGDLFVRCFRPQVIRLAREHLKAYQEALPDRESFCNSLDEIRQHLLKHFGVRYFSQDLQAEFDEWEESAWEGETRPGLGFAGQNVATRGEASPVGRRPISEQDQRELAKIIAPHLKGEAWKTPSILEETEESRAKRRQAFVQPILDELGWSEFRWAKQAHCNPKTVEGYLSGRTIGLQKRSRSDLAKALDVEPELCTDSA